MTVLWRDLTPHELVGEDRSRLVIGPFGSSLKTSDYRDSGVPLVFVRDIRGGDFSAPRHCVSPEKAAELRSHIVLPGDVLITKMGAPPGDTAIYTGTKPAVITADCIRLRPTEEFDPKYVAYALRAPDAARQIEKITNGVAQRKVSLGRFRSGVTVRVPPIREQRRIVAFLDDHLSRVDAADAYLDAAERRLGAWCHTLVDDAIWSGDPRTSTVGDLLREPMRNGRSDRAATGEEPGTRTLTLTSVTRNRFDNEFTKMTITSPEVAAGLWLEPGDIFVQRSNTPELVGTAARYDGPSEWAIYPDLLIRLRPDESRIDGRYLVAALRSRSIHRSLRKRAKGLAGSMPKIDQRAIAQTVVPLPDSERQAVAIERIAEIDRLGASTSAAIAQQRKRLAALRLSLLAAAFSGGLSGAVAGAEVLKDAAV